MISERVIALKIKISSYKIKIAIFSLKMYLFKILIQSKNYNRIYASSAKHNKFYKFIELISSAAIFLKHLYLKLIFYSRIQEFLNKNFLFSIKSSNEYYGTQFKKAFKLGDCKSNFNRFTISLSILILFNNFLIASCICPRLCECKWKSGKESVLCVNANISNIPNYIDTGTQILDLTGNLITNIRNDVFANLELLNLQKVIFAKCRLKVIERFAFRELTNLIELDLSYNRLFNIPSHTFEFIPELREIRLSGNPIQKILNDAFMRVPKLTRIELSDCNISIIELKAFRGIEESLEWLKLNNNKLIHVPSESFIRLKNLHGLELYQNLWNCSCYLRPLRVWMIREKIPYNVPPTCNTPSRLFNKSWEKIDLDEFACIPKIIANQITVYGIEGKNVTLGCFIQDNGEMNIRWTLKERLIANLSYNNFNNYEFKNNTEVATEFITSTNHGRKIFLVNLVKSISNLSISIVEQRDAGIYTCLAENKAGSAEAHITLIVSRKYLNSTFGKNFLFLCVFIILILVTFLLIIGFWKLSVKNKRKHVMLWHNIPSRCNSYEKIEMDHNIILPGNDPICNTITEPNIIEKKNIKENKVENNQKNYLKGKIQNFKYYSKQYEIDKNNSENIFSQSLPLNENALFKTRDIDSISNNFRELNAPCLTMDSLQNRPKSDTSFNYHQNSAEYFSDLERICASGISDLNGIFTLPRNSRNLGKNSFSTTFNSQSYLLPENHNQYDQSNSFEKLRRYSDESAYLRKTNDIMKTKRSNSTLSLCNTDQKISTSSTALDLLNLNRQMCFSSTNQKELPTKYLNCEHETPLLNFSSSYRQNKKSNNHASTSSLNDFHAAQLERFLEEYRSLQEQLCKMKETCEEICKKETSWKKIETNSSITYNDQGIFDGVLSEIDIQTSSEMLINKSLPLKTPEPPPYWMHQNEAIHKLSKSPYKIYRS